MQWRQNKYQRNKQGYVIDNSKGKEDDKGKTNEETVATKNSFDILEAEETDQSILRITDRNEDDNATDKNKKIQLENV